MNHAELTALLNTIHTIALVGASPKPHRPSYEVMAFLQAKGFKVHPVNPSLDGQTLLTENVFATLDALPEPVDMVEIFRNSEDAGETCEEVLKLPLERRPKVVWMQVGVINESAAQKLRDAGIIVVMDNCPKRVLSAQAESSEVSR